MPIRLLFVGVIGALLAACPEPPSTPIIPGGAITIDVSYGKHTNELPE